jgi:hypothetical protein
VSVCGRALHVLHTLTRHTGPTASRRATVFFSCAHPCARHAPLPASSARPPPAAPRHPNPWARRRRAAQPKQAPNTQSQTPSAAPNTNPQHTGPARRPTTRRPRRRPRKQARIRTPPPPHLERAGRAEAGALLELVAQHGVDLVVRGADDGGAPRPDVIDVLVAVHVPAVGALDPVKHDRVAADRAERADGRVDAAGEERARLGHDLRRRGGAVAPGRYWTRCVRPRARGRRRPASRLRKRARATRLLGARRLNGPAATPGRCAPTTYDRSGADWPCTTPTSSLFVVFSVLGSTAAVAARTTGILDALREPWARCAAEGRAVCLPIDCIAVISSARSRWGRWLVMKGTRVCFRNHEPSGSKLRAALPVIRLPKFLHAFRCLGCVNGRVGAPIARCGAARGGRPRAAAACVRTAAHPRRPNVSMEVVD